MLYRILYENSAGENRFWDVESNSLSHAIWTVAQQVGRGELVDTMILPSRENIYNFPTHVELQPSLDVS